VWGSIVSAFTNGNASVSALVRGEMVKGTQVRPNTILWIGGFCLVVVTIACCYMLYLSYVANQGPDNFEFELKACRGRPAATCKHLEGRWRIIHPRLVRDKAAHIDSLFLAQTDREEIYYVEIRDNRVVDVAFNEECKLVPELEYDY